MTVEGRERALIRFVVVLVAYFGLCFAATFDTSYSDVLPVARRPLTFYMISPPMVLLLFFGSMWAIAPLLKQE